MSLISASHDSLPYIDRPLTPPTTTLANTLITASLDPAHASEPHPSLPELSEPRFSELIQAELERIAAGRPFEGGVDASRYEPGGFPGPNDGQESKEAALRQAYTTSTHLSHRLTNLTLLSSFGQNSWLIGNSQMEAVLAELERELSSLKEETELVNRERKRKQVEVQDELERLERQWKDGVGRVLEVEVAGEMVFRETLERRKAGGGIA